MLNPSYTSSEVGEALLNLASNIPVNKMLSIGTLENADGTTFLKIAVADSKTLEVSQTNLDAEACDERTDAENFEIVGEAVSSVVDALFEKNEAMGFENDWDESNPAENN